MNEEERQVVALTPGWFVGFPEFLHECGLPTTAADIQEQLDEYHDGLRARIDFDDDSEAILPYFMTYKSARSRYN